MINIRKGLKMKKQSTLLLMILFFYTYGVLTVFLGIFPYEQLRDIKNYVLSTDENIPDDSNAEYIGRNVDVTGLINAPTETIKEPLVFITYGQSNSVNSGQLGYETSEDVYMFLNGETYKYHDPALGGTGGNGSVWGRVGDQLIQNNVTNSVVFVNTGWGGATLNILTNTGAYIFFDEQLRSVMDEYGKIDGILFHQGESNHQHKGGSSEYESDFLTLLSNIRNLTDAPFYLSQVSLCQNNQDELLLKIQDKLIREYKGVLRGPNSDLLFDPKFRLPDYCHFSKAGLDELSRMWLESIMDKSEI